MKTASPIRTKLQGWLWVWVILQLKIRCGSAQCLAHGERLMMRIEKNSEKQENTDILICPCFFIKIVLNNIVFYVIMSLQR